MTPVVTLDILQACFEVILDEVVTLTQLVHLCFLGFDKVEIVRGSLIEKAKVWFDFMSSRHHPSKHVSIVHRDRAVLLYAILMNYKFNVGNIIQNSLVEDVGKSLIHPSLITQLCKDAKVVIMKDEE